MQNFYHLYARQELEITKMAVVVGFWNTKLVELISRFPFFQIFSLRFYSHEIFVDLHWIPQRRVFHLDPELCLLRPKLKHYFIWERLYFEKKDLFAWDHLFWYIYIEKHMFYALNYSAQVTRYPNTVHPPRSYFLGTHIYQIYLSMKQPNFHKW